jgi:hypothetical protein
MPEIDPSAVRDALIVAFDLNEPATAEDLNAAVDQLDGPGSLRVLRTLAGLLRLQEGEAA